MTDKEWFLKLFQELLDKHVINDMTDIAKRLLESGAIDFDLFVGNRELLPYLLVAAVSKEISDKYMPRYRFWRKFVNNLRRF